MSKIPEIAFDSNNASIIAFTVRTGTNNAGEQANKMKHLFGNNTISIFGKLISLTASKFELLILKLLNR